MTALTANLSINGTIASLDGPLKVGQFYHLEDEVVQCTGSVTLNYADVTQGNRWRLSRGEDSTIAATHISGTALTLAREYEAGGAGGGAIAVDNTVDPPAEVTTLIAPGATIAGDEATLGKWAATSAASGDIDYSTTVTASHENGVAIVNRNAIGIGGANSEANTTATAVDGDAEADTTVTVAGAEDANARTIATTASGAADVSRSATATDPDGSANANTSATAAGATGNAQANTSVSVGGDGNADLLLAATVEGTGMAVVSVMSSRGAAEAGMRTETDATSARLGFNGTAPIAKPTGVAVTAEAIHAALVSLGLIAA